jgi:hypothetical protein
MTIDNLANVPHPAGATSVGDWYDPDLPIGATPSEGPGYNGTSAAARG